MHAPLKSIARGLIVAVLVCATSAFAPGPQVLYRFTGQGDGANPSGALVIDHQGVLYGIAGQGGPGNSAVVYRAEPDGRGAWSERVVHAFAPAAAGEVPFAALTIGREGALFGSVSHYPNGSGAVFELSRSGDAWSYQAIARFPGAGSQLGGFLSGNLLIGAQGQIIGVAYDGGDEAGSHPCDCGLIYSLARPSNSGPWTETVLSTFKRLPDGNNPYAGLTLGPAGSLFGTTSMGGTGRCLDGSGVVVVGCGTLFTLSSGKTQWLRADLYSFRQAGPSQPSDTLSLGPDDALYGFDTLVAYRFAPPGVPGADGSPPSSTISPVGFPADRRSGRPCSTPRATSMA